MLPIRLASTCAALLPLLAAVPPNDLVRVHVTTPEREPASGVRVLVEQNEHGRFVAVASSVTDGYGVATFADAERWFTPAAQASGVRVRADVAATSEVTADLRGDRAPSSLVDLVLPRGQRVDVWVRVPTGLDLTGWFVRLEQAASDGASAWNWESPPSALGPGQQVVTYVCNSRSVDAYLVRPDGERWSHHRTTNGFPARLDAGPRDLVLEGRLMDERRLEEHPDVRVVGIGPVQACDVVAVGTDGRFRATFALYEQEVLPRRIDSVRVSIRGRVATRALGEPPLDGHIDLGDLWCESRVAFARGRVEDEAGRPIHGARVTAIPRRSGALVVSAPETDVVDVTDANGEFELLTRTLDEDTADLRIESAGCWMEHLDLRELRARRGVVTLHQPFALSGRVDVPADVDPTELVVELEYADRRPSTLAFEDHPSDSGLRGVALKANGEFRLDAVRAGQADVRVVRRTKEPALFAKKLEVSSASSPLVIDLAGARR